MKIKGNIPSYQTGGSSGADLCVVEKTYIMPGETKLVSTGTWMEIPEGYEGQIRSRSGLALNSQLVVFNSPGTIDSDYRGEIKIMLHNFDTTNIKILEAGMRVAQIVFTPVVHAEFEVIDDLSVSERGSGGFGHTGV